ncbi:hypothetical protein LS73_008435 [Helicobacter muridarum]|uniref:Short chain dehydrogenase n=1 Tax=Helicobacter muridarum TaxID=216 RepID=A0A099U045_9HELI|nr:hypothetical protein [Helicobacter muridarum]TLD98687.1 hypothetical protein LS73_008435 [Helicobacter muridarum]STQ85557.1 short chain dehydrogenase [Helicobacter muridarum]
MKYILITGATSDIGKEISHRLKENNLILHGRNRLKLDSLYASLNNPSNIIWEHDLEDIDNLALSLQNAIQDNNTLKYGGGGKFALIYCRY